MMNNSDKQSNIESLVFKGKFRQRAFLKKKILRLFSHTHVRIYALSNMKDSRSSRREQPFFKNRPFPARIKID